MFNLKVPSISLEYELSEAQIKQYQKNGHIHLKNVALREEVDAFREIIKSSIREFFDERRLMQIQGIVDDYNSYFTQVTNLWQKDEIVKQFVFAEKFARIASELMQVSGVRLYHDQALFKDPGSLSTPWHQDHYYWPINSKNTITMWLPLVDVTKEMGTMRFASGSNKSGYFAEQPISPDSDNYFENIIKQNGFDVVSDNLSAGDATFHSGLTLHSAFGNKSNTTREVMTIIYYEDGVEVLKPDNKHKQVDMEVFFPGLKPGDLAASELNPLLYIKKY